MKNPMMVPALLALPFALSMSVRADAQVPPEVEQSLAQRAACEASLPGLYLQYNEDSAVANELKTAARKLAQREQRRVRALANPALKGKKQFEDILTKLGRGSSCDPVRDSNTSGRGGQHHLYSSCARTLPDGTEIRVEVGYFVEGMIGTRHIGGEVWVDTQATRRIDRPDSQAARGTPAANLALYGSATFTTTPFPSSPGYEDSEYASFGFRVQGTNGMSSGLPEGDPRDGRVSFMNEEESAHSLPDKTDYRTIHSFETFVENLGPERCDQWLARGLQKGRYQIAGMTYSSDPRSSDITTVRIDPSTDAGLDDMVRAVRALAGLAR